MSSVRCDICDHEYNQHSQSGCQFTTCSCEEFKVKKQEEKVKTKQNSATQNLREKLDKWAINPDAFKHTSPTPIKQESIQDRQSSQSEIWDKVEKNWSKIDKFTEFEEYEKVEKLIDMILEIKFENISAWIKKGHNCINLKKYDEAIFCYNNAIILDRKENIKSNRKDYEILNFLGVAHQHNKNYEVAKNYFKDALKIKEDFIPSLEELGWLYKNLDEYDLAKEQYIKLLKIDDNNIDALDNLGHCYELKNEYDEAIKCYDKSKQIESKKNSDNYADIRLAICYLEKNDLEHAEFLINKEKITKSETQLSYETRGRILRDKKEYDNAILNFENQLKLNPNSITAWYDLAWSNGMKGNHELALEYYKKNLEINDNLDENTSYAIGYELEMLGRKNEAKNWYQQELSKYPQNRQILNALADEVADLEEYDEAIKIRNKICEIYPDNHLALLEKSYLLLNMNRFEESLQCIDNILNQDEQKNGPSKAVIMNQKGWVLFKKGELEESMKWIEKSLAIKPKNVNTLDSKAEVLVKQKNYEDAEKVYEEIFKLEEDDIVKRKIADCKRLRGNQIKNDDEIRRNYYNEAIKIYESILEKNKTISSVWYNKGLCLWNLNKYDDALNSQLQAIKINPNDEDIWNELGDIARDMDKNEQAIVYYNKSIELKPNIYALNEKGALLYKKKIYAEAIVCYDKALEIKFDQTTLLNKSNAFHMLTRYDEAIEGYDKILGIDSENIDAFQNKGNTLRLMKKYEESLKHINMAIEKFPEDSYSYRRKSLLYADQEEYEKSLEIINDMLKKFPDEEEEIMNDFISIYTKMENFDMVKEYEEKLQKLNDLK